MIPEEVIKGYSAKDLWDLVRVDTLTDPTNGSNIFSNDVAENDTKYILGVLLSDTSSGANGVDVSKVEEDDTTTTWISGFNVGSDESKALPVEDFNPLGIAVPPVQGGANLEFNAESAMEITVFWIPDEVL